MRQLQGEGGDKICHEDILRRAYALARANAGEPGRTG
jgi:hypothetical protein